MVAVYCREMCFSDKAGGETKSGQHLLQEKVFHGSSGYASVLETLLEGKGAYASMFDCLPIQNNREGNEHRTSGFMLELKDIFTCDEGEQYR